MEGTRSRRRPAWRGAGPVVALAVTAATGALATANPAAGTTVPTPARTVPGSGATAPLVRPYVLQGSALPSVLVWGHSLPDRYQPVAESSPTPATLDGAGPAVVVGDRAGNLYAYHLSDGSVVPGWPAQTPGAVPVDSTPSVSPAGAHDDVFVGAGNAGNPLQGGYESFGPDGRLLWNTQVVDPPSDGDPALGVQASLTVGSLGGQTGVVAGSLDQQDYALDPLTGSPLGGWPFFASDSIFSTAAVADLYGTGQTEIVQGGAQTAGFARGQTYRQGGHLRILNARGGLVCDDVTNQTVDSSPAVGGFLAGEATGAVFGTGGYFAGASDSDTVKAVDTHCNQVWSTTLDGGTTSSPALADVLGNGRLQVVEGTDDGSDHGVGGSVWVLDPTDGAPIWHQPVPGRVIGSVTTADLTGAGHQDILVPTTVGLSIFDGQTAKLLATLNVPGSCPFGLQNSPLVTDDPNGTVGITIAGYDCNNQGVIEHFELTGARGSIVDEPGSWPEFHHDPQLTGDAGGTPDPGAVSACTIPSAAQPGYDLVASDGGIFSFAQPFCGSTGGITLARPVVGMAMARATGGYWLVASDGGVFAFGGAGFYGSMGGHPLNQPIVGMAATPDGRGYWLVAADGGIFAFGDAGFFGSTGDLHLNKPIVGMAATADGLGYRFVAADGGVFAFGDAQFLGSMGGTHLTAPVVGLATDQATGGYWLVAADGGVFAFGAPFFGSTGAIHLNQPVVGMAVTTNGGGYRFVAADGGVFAFGDAPFHGSMGGIPLNRPVVGMAGA